MKSPPHPPLPKSARLAVSAIGVGLSLSFSGCLSELSEEERHLEHVRPDHKPENYAAAIAELRTRSQAFFEASESETERQELREIIDWLPELAGNSDLRRPQWEQVQSTAGELAALHARSSEGASRVDQETWNDRLDELEALVPAAGRPERLVVHHHDHIDDLHGPDDSPEQPDVPRSAPPTQASPTQAQATADGEDLE